MTFDALHCALVNWQGRKLGGHPHGRPVKRKMPIENCSIASVVSFERTLRLLWWFPSSGSCAVARTDAEVKLMAVGRQNVVADHRRTRKHNIQHTVIRLIS